MHSPIGLKFETLLHYYSQMNPIVWGGRPVTGSAGVTALGNTVSGQFQANYCIQTLELQEDYAVWLEDEPYRFCALN